MIRSIKNLSLIGKIRRWKMIFWISNPWQRRDFENTAEQEGVSYESRFDAANNRMIYAITDVNGGDITEFLKAFCSDRGHLYKFFQEDAYGVRIVHIAEKAVSFE